MIDKIKKDMIFYRKYLIPRLKSKGDAGYKSEQIAEHISRFLDNVEAYIFNSPQPKEPAATPEQADRIFNHADTV